MRGKPRFSMFRARKLIGLFVVSAIVVTLSVALLVYAQATDETEIQLQPGPFAPGSTGAVSFTVQNGVLSGTVEAQNLPAQGSHAFYVLWFVRTDTGNKAFLGPVIKDDSILFMTAGDAEMRFRAPAFTDGPAKGSPITLGTAGNNFFVLIAENKIDTFMPFPVSTPPTSFALMATF